MCPPDGSWSDALSGIENQISTTADNYIAAGTPALEASVEQQGINWLTQQKNAAQAQTTAAVTKINNTPTDPNGLGASFANVIKNAELQTYGIPIVLVVAAIAFVVLF